MLISIKFSVAEFLNSCRVARLPLWWIKTAAVAGICILLTAQSLSAEIEGRYRTVGKVPETNSLPVVQFDEYINFTCPHCNNFRKAAIPMKRKYGKRIKITYIPILFQNQADTPLRLFYIGVSVGRTEEIKNLIFDAAFGAGVNIYDPAIVSYLARTAGLGEKYQKEANAPWVTQKVNLAQRRSSQVGVTGTPTVVLQGSLLVEPKSGMQAFVGNLDNLIGQLLKK